MVSARVLIIDDDYLIAQEITRVVENLGQRVSGPAATYEEAMVPTSSGATGGSPGWRSRASTGSRSS